MLSQPNYPSRCQLLWFLEFMWFQEWETVFSLNEASWRGAGLQSVPVWGFLNKAKLVNLRAAPCPRCMGLICSLLSSPTWIQFMRAQHPVSVTPKATAEPSSLPMLGPALLCLPLCHRWVSPLGPPLCTHVLCPGLHKAGQDALHRITELQHGLRWKGLLKVI